jgi:phosphoglycolate phosphatase
MVERHSQIFRFSSALKGRASMQQLFHRLGGIDHVIWDWNGTLLNDVPHAVDTINFLLEPRGLPLMSIERYREVFSFPIRQYYETLGFDLQAESFADLCDQFMARFLAKVGECPLAPGSRELLAQIKAAGKKQSVLSATEQGCLRGMMSQFGLSQYFDFVFGIADKLAVGKVQRGHDLMRESGVPPTRTLLIGDTDHDLEVAQALGISVLLVTHGHQSEERLKRLHHDVIDISAL